MKYCFFNILSSALLLFCSSALFIGCAPKITPPPLYKDIDLTLDEIIETAQRDINTLKAVASIKIEKDDNPYSFIDASLLFKKPNWLQMRWYKFGMLTGNLLIKDNIVHAISGKGAHRFKELGSELYYSVFWWENTENASMYKQGTEYVIRTKNKEIHIDKSTLLPQSQEITANGNKIYIKYDKPTQTHTDTQSSADFWYPSEAKIETGSYRFTVKIVKLTLNPTLEENDFKTPEAE